MPLGEKSSERVKRYPTVKSGVTLGANATLIGDITVGERSTVGAGAVVTDDIPAGATVVGTPARRVDESTDVELASSQSVGRLELILSDVLS